MLKAQGGKGETEKRGSGDAGTRGYSETERGRVSPGIRETDGSLRRADYRKASSIGTRKPFARRFVSLAMPTTARSSPNISSVMPFLRAAAV